MKHLKFKEDFHGSRKCFYLGHVYDEHGNYCTYCELPAYITDDGYNWLPRIEHKWWQIKTYFRLLPRQYIQHCGDPRCRKVEQVFGVKVGEHKRCSPLPF